MTNRRAEELSEPQGEFQLLQPEAGVADLMELYESIEGIYSQAVAWMSPVEPVYTSNSTNSGIIDGYMGTNT
jgi:hypothetical protein